MKPEDSCSSLEREPWGLLDEFDTIDEHAKIYRKRATSGCAGLRLPLPAAGRAAHSSAVTPRNGGVNPHSWRRRPAAHRFMPPSFLVDEHGQLIDTFGGVESLLRVKARRPSQNLLDMVGDDLRTAISGALHRVRRDEESVRYPAVPVTGDGHRLSLVAEPLRDPQGGLMHVLISLAPARPPPLRLSFRPLRTSPGHDRVRPEPATDGASRDRIHALEEELSYTKERLQSAGGARTANEELPATNEELIAANEELQSTTKSCTR